MDLNIIPNGGHYGTRCQILEPTPELRELIEIEKKYSELRDLGKSLHNTHYIEGMVTNLSDFTELVDTLQTFYTEQIKPLMDKSNTRYRR